MVVGGCGGVFAAGGLKGVWWGVSGNEEELGKPQWLGVG